MEIVSKYCSKLIVQMYGDAFANNIFCSHCRLFKPTYSDFVFTKHSSRVSCSQNEFVKRYL